MDPPAQPWLSQESPRWLLAWSDLESFVSDNIRMRVRAFSALRSRHPFRKRSKAAPTRPSPSIEIVVGSGTALVVIWPCTVVIPLFEAGGTRFSGLFVML
jgi:hypothetical protein